jgi:hypothetical protein
MLGAGAFLGGGGTLRDEARKRFISEVYPKARNR